MAHRPTDLLAADAVLLRREAIERGIDDDALRRLVRSGVLVRIRQGAYAETRTWESADALARHRMLTAAVLRLYDDTVVLSHVSAAVAQGAPIWGAGLDSIHLTHTGSGGRRLARVVHHRAKLGVEDLSRHEHGWITSPARTVADLGRSATTETALIVGNDFVRRGLTSK